MFSFYTHDLYGQKVKAALAKDRTRNFIWVVPSHAKEINGWAIGYGVDISPHDSVVQTINGLHTNLQPFHVFIVGFGAPYMIVAPFNVFKDLKGNGSLATESDDAQTTQNTHKPSYINGMSLYMFGFGYAEDYITNGIEISTAILATKKSNGLSVAAIMSGHEEINGVAIAGLMNVSHKTNGLQIGLVNYTKDLSGVQIGLLNRVGNRIIPFVNIGFGKKSDQKKSP